MRIAITREISAALARCELTHLERREIDLPLARRQHADYERALESLGCRVVRLPQDPDLPDSVFVEDVAVVLGELAVLTRPGAPSRRGETPAVEAALRPYRRLRRIEEPGTLDGGDVLVVGPHVYVGDTGRTNRAGFVQLRDLLGPLGYSVARVAVRGCLHLKSAVTRVARDLLLLNPERVEAEAFPGLRAVAVDPEEPAAANALLVGGSVIFPGEFPRTRGRLQEAGVDVVTVAASELAKAEGAVTCCSLVLEIPATSAPI
ncbi:MAG: dimethylargininase [Candidatus Eisenbacteria bacterium]|nr:dimethylargininase [Candidatus Eisenbacteria bacterium]